MAPSRLSLALDEGLVRFAEEDAVVVWGATRDHNLTALPETATLITPFRPDFEAFTAQGRKSDTKAPDRASQAVVFLPRSKTDARGMIAEAARVTNGSVVVDGQKSDGIDGILRDLKRMGDLGPSLSKSHGKLAVLASGADLEAWTSPGPSRTPEGYLTCPGVFSADGVDPGSLRLAEALPKKLGSRVADLGAGWGYLASRALQNDSIKEMHLVEADLRALECARTNVDDPRATFHWADALTFDAQTGFDSVLMNPPFHKGRAGDPGLGQGFIQAAARLLRPGGQVWLVANRHLPYERSLNAAFGEVAEIGGDRSYKLFRAARPLRQGARP